MDDAARAIQKRFPLIPDEASAHMVRHGTRATEEGFAWKYDSRVRVPSYTSFTESQVRAFIDRIRCPTLLIFGSDGGYMASPRFGRVGLFKNAKVVKIPGAGHHVPHEKPVELAEVISTFLRA
jgi:pimeloyl-ACP methyl ester carboxylesterase